jgi:hypothetical protein
MQWLRFRQNIIRAIVWRFCIRCISWNCPAPCRPDKLRSRRGLAAAKDWSRTRTECGRGLGLDTDVNRPRTFSRTGRSHAQTAVVVTDWAGHGLTTSADADRTRTGHGQTVVAENSCSWSWKNRGKFLAAAWAYSVDFPGRCREIARLLRGC